MPGLENKSGGIPDFPDGGSWPTLDLRGVPGDAVVGDVGALDSMSLSLKGDVLEVADLTRKIGSIVSFLLSELGLLGKGDPRIDELKKDFHKIKLRAFGLDKIFNPPPRSSDFDANNRPIFHHSPIIVIYNNKNEISFATKTYVVASGLKSLDEIKKAAIDGDLYIKIYDESTLDELTRLLPELHSDGGYVDRVLTMKNTGRRISWNSLGKDGSVRVGEDRTDMWGYDILPSIPNPELDNIRFNFNNLVLNYKNKLLKILEEMSSADRNFVAQATSRVNGFNKLSTYFNELNKLSLIGDRIVDHGSYMVNITDSNGEVFMNKRYVAATGYPPEVLYDLASKGKLIKALYGFNKLEEEHVENNLARLRKLSLEEENKGISRGSSSYAHYTNMFTLRRFGRDQNLIDTIFDSFGIGEGESARIGRIVSPEYNISNYSFNVRYYDMIRLFNSGKI